MDTRTGELILEKDLAARILRDPSLARFVKPAPMATREMLLRSPPRVMPNERCPCGSGKKFKKCCQYKLPEN